MLRDLDPTQLARHRMLSRSLIPREFVEAPGKGRLDTFPKTNEVRATCPEFPPLHEQFRHNRSTETGISLGCTARSATVLRNISVARPTPPRREYRIETGCALAPLAETALFRSGTKSRCTPTTTGPS